MRLRRPVTHPRTILAVVGTVGLALVLAAAAHAAQVPVTGGVYTTVDTAIDGTGHCFNGNPSVNCNQYGGKQYVWLNGGPNGARLGPDGQWMFAVLVPGSQPNPNDGSAGNLSSPNDAHTNRTFVVTNGQIASYSGTHTYDAANHMIRLMTYNNTTNSGGVYIMAVCYLGPAGGPITYPVTASACKYDAFKVTTTADNGPPKCTLTLVGLNMLGQKYIQVTLEDTVGGLESVTVNTSDNAVVTMPDVIVGQTSPLTVTGTKQIQTKSSAIRLTVVDVAGNTVVCDPIVPGRKAPARDRAPEPKQTSSTTTVRRTRFSLAGDAEGD
jgi:hypothetical protein